jgi:DNA-binding PadR family transcriptional regulator
MSEYEAEILFVLAASKDKPEWPRACDIAKQSKHHAHISREAIYPVLDRLMKKGYVESERENHSYPPVWRVTILRRYAATENGKLAYFEWCKQRFAKNRSKKG